MALNSGKILMRRGQEVNFDPNKMTPGEWAVSLDSKYVRMCFQPGVCVRMATYDAFEADMVQIQRILAECQTVEEAVQRIYEDIKDVAVDVERIEAAAASALESEENALNSANSAVQSANTATQKASDAAGSANTASAKAEQATEGARIATEKANEAAYSAENVRNMSDVSQSYAVGGTGTREGEDTDNSKYYNQQASDNADRAEAAAERASAVADVGVATTEKAGLVKPDGETIRVDPDGTIHADRGTTSYTDLENKPTINNVELTGNKTLEELGIASKEALEKTDSKVNIIIEQAELRFKETASGENIHLDDSADSKLVEFGLYGKATQNGTPTPENPVEIAVAGESYNLLENKATSKTVNNIVYIVNADGSITANGTTVNSYADFLINTVTLPIGNYVMKPTGAGWNCYFIVKSQDNSELISNGGDGIFSLSNETTVNIYLTVGKDKTVNNLTVYPMLFKETLQNDRYMPYGKGSVEVKSVGKNLFDELLEDYSLAGSLQEGYSLYNAANSQTFVGKININKNYTIKNYSDGNRFRIVLFKNYPTDKTAKDALEIVKNSGLSEYTFNSLKYKYAVFTINANNANIKTKKAQLEIGTVATEYEPYKETFSTVPTPNGLAGIPVDSSGNYTDENGQQWICDEVVKYADGSGEKIQRVGIIDSYSAETITGVYMSTTGELTEGAKILYQLAKPITTSLTAEELAEIEKLSTFYSVTNISNDADCGMKVKYIADAKSYIDNRLALIEQAMLNSI